MEKEEIEHLIAEIKSGSLEQFEIIIDQFQQPLFRYCYHMLGHPQEAEDAVQEVLFKAYKHLDQFTYSLSFSAWLYKIAFHHCASLLKRKKLARLLPFIPYTSADEGRDDIEEKIAQTYISEPLHTALSKLSTEERHIVIMRVLEEKEYEEIAVLLDKKAATLRKKFERALKKCKHHIQESGGIAGEARRFI
ncbi:RNA polymerase sigma factor [Brevibacillus formosus]|uniref:RNA polymerase sigma factor n=1 Tax=Brevibacillus formosus TaxID=54913 RepID=UPI003F1A4D9C